MFHCGPDEVLLAGLAAAFTRWLAGRGQHVASVLVDVENHGRQPLTPGMDLSRAVGWFTSVHPIRLGTGPVDLAQVRDGGPAAGQLLKTIKEQARAVPGDGLGYGLLRYQPDGDALAGRPHAQVGFNYLGRFSTSPGPQAAPPGPQPGPPGPQPAPPGRRYWTTGSLGGDVDPATPVKHALEASAITRDTPDGLMLRLSLSWPDGLLQETGRRMGRHARRPGPPRRAPSRGRAHPLRLPAGGTGPGPDRKARSRSRG
jgi:nonribosomal peptide synthetase CepB